MGTWCTEGVKRQIAATHARNHLSDVCREKRQQQARIAELEKEKRQLQELLAQANGSKP